MRKQKQPFKVGFAVTFIYYTVGNIVQLSGGKDSTAMLIILTEMQKTGNLPYSIDEALFFDTGMEFDAVICFERMKRMGEKWRETFSHWEMDTVKGSRGTSKKSLLVRQIRTFRTNTTANGNTTP